MIAPVRCDNPGCVLRLRHKGDCRALWSRKAMLCGAWMPNAKERCARYAGHAEGLGGGHRTRFALDCNRDSDWLGVA